MHSCRACILVHCRHDNLQQTPDFVLHDCFAWRFFFRINGGQAYTGHCREVSMGAWPLDYDNAFPCSLQRCMLLHPAAFLLHARMGSCTVPGPPVPASPQRTCARQAGTQPSVAIEKGPVVLQPTPPANINILYSQGIADACRSCG